MKFEGRHNEFIGDSYHVHMEMDAKDTPLGFKILFGCVWLGIFGGVVFAIIHGVNFVESIFLILGFAFLGISALGFWMAYLKKQLNDVKVVLSIFVILGILFLLVPLLIKIFDPWKLLIFGILFIFLSVGFGLLIAGLMKRKQVHGNCTVEIMALCTDIETVSQHMMLLDDEDATYAQNEVIARADASRPVWEYDYNGLHYRSTPIQYTGRLKINRGETHKIRINPNDPNELFCEENNGYKLFIIMGIIFLIETVLFGIPGIIFSILMYN